MVYRKSKKTTGGFMNTSLFFKQYDKNTNTSPTNTYTDEDNYVIKNIKKALKLRETYKNFSGNSFTQQFDIHDKESKVSFDKFREGFLNQFNEDLKKLNKIFTDMRLITWCQTHLKMLESLFRVYRKENWEKELENEQ